MYNPKISIIIPCFNCEKTLEEAVSSCYLQGFVKEDFEIVLVDDCSEDNTIKIMQNIALKYNNVFLFFNTKNQGGGATRNTAVKNSKSEVIFCLDSDDILPPNTLLKMYNYLQEKKSDGVAFNYSIKFNCDDPNNINYIDRFQFTGEKIPIESLISNKNGSCPLHVVFMFTKHAFEIAGGYPTDHGFDTQGFAWRFLTAGLTAYTCPDTKYLHRINYGKSYYVRGSENGLINYYWQKILLENFNLLSKDAQKILLNFDCSNFTRNIFEEIKKTKKIFKKDYLNFVGKDNSYKGLLPKQLKPIKKNSARGIFMRISNKIKNIFN